MLYLFIAIYLGGIVIAIWKVAAILVLPTEKDNGADMTVRIILWTWWTAGIVVFLFTATAYIRNQWRNTPAGYTRLTSTLVIGFNFIAIWHAVYLLIVGFLIVLNMAAGSSTRESIDNGDDSSIFG